MHIKEYLKYRWSMETLFWTVLAGKFHCFSDIYMSMCVCLKRPVIRGLEKMYNNILIMHA